MKPLFQTADALFASAVLLTVGWVGAQASGHLAEAQPPLEQFAVATDGDILLLPVTFEGKTQLFLVDTGTVVTVFDKALLLGQPTHRIPVETVSGNKDIDMFDAPNAQVGKLSLRSGPYVLGTDLRMLRLVSGREISGIIGMDFLSNYVVQIDFDAGKLSFLPSAVGDVGTPSPILREMAGPCVQVNIPGLELPEKFLIDTGSTDSAGMTTQLMKALSKEGKARAVGFITTVGLASMGAKEKWLVESLTVAGSHYRDIVALTQHQDNLLGLGFWAGHIVTFDFPNGVMYLKRSSRPCRHKDLDLSGLHILRVEGKTIVHSVDEGSPAAVRGIRPNDVLLTIAGERAEQRSMFAIRQQLCCESKDLRFTILRGEETIEVTIDLGKVLPADIREKPSLPD